jgi:hypothetical protein
MGQRPGLRFLNIPHNGLALNRAASACHTPRHLFEDDFDVFNVGNASARITFHHYQIGVLSSRNRADVVLAPRKVAPFKVAIRIACVGVNPAPTSNSISY